MLAHGGSPKDFGVATLLVAIAEVTRVVADLGLDTWATREFVKERGRIAAAQIYMRVLFAKVVLGLFFGVIASGIALAMVPTDECLAAVAIGLLVPAGLLTNLVIS